MSVTITIVHNRQHAIDTGSMLYEEFDCQCEGGHGCSECGGTGKVRFERLRFEMNVANGNFDTLWSALGLDLADRCGSMDGRVLQAAVRCADEALIVREGTREQNYIDCGIGQGQAASYLARLMEIAVEAERREELVVWG